MQKVDRKHIVSTLKDRLMLSQIVSLDTKLVRKGNEYIGSCPLHQEKTASFFVNDSMGSYFCFGCKESGDIIQYIIKKRNVNFNQAIQILADMAGIEIQSSGGNYSSARQSDILDVAAEFYRIQLISNNAVLEYCKSRDISLESINNFGLGYSGNFYELCDILKRSGYSTNEIREAGLEKFKNRLIFPIYSRSGRVIAFGGRSLNNDIMPKYINSNDSERFHKQTVLYGYNIASRNISRTNGFIVVEGYIDVISMHQYGFNTTIASMGTSFSIKHIQQIWQYCDNCTLCFDGDSAGNKAATKAAFLCLENAKPGKNTQICSLPNKDDPASLLQNCGANAMNDVISNSQYLSDFIWGYFVEVYNKIDAKTPESIAHWKHEIHETINRIQDKNVQMIYRAQFKENIYQLLHAKNNISTSHKNPHSNATNINKQLIYECILLYTLKRYHHHSDVILERLHDIHFQHAFTDEARSLALSGQVDLIDFAQIEKVVDRYYDFDTTDSNQIEGLISSILGWFISAEFEGEDVSDDQKYLFLHNGSTEEWDRLKRIKTNKIKQ